MNANEYLHNPVLPPTFYNVKCLDVEAVDGRTVIVKLKVVPYEPYGEAQNAVLYATLRDAPAAQPMHDLFRQTFRVQDDPAEAVGRFGCVKMRVDEFQGEQYGGVHFINQSGPARRDARGLELADEDGEIPWAAEQRIAEQ
jgi:hypothetical protein